MNKTTAYLFDVVMLVLVMGWSILNLPALMRATNEPIIAGIEDKTALEVNGSIYDSSAVQTGADLVAALLNVDANTPYPRAIKVNDSPVMKLDGAFYANKQNNLSLMFSASGDYKLSTMLDYSVESVTFVPDNNGDYWHYVLIE